MNVYHLLRHTRVLPIFKRFFAALRPKTQTLRNEAMRSTASDKNEKWDSWFEENLTRITVPTKMTRRIERIKAKKAEDAEKDRLICGCGPLIISCKRAIFNHRVGQKYGSNEINPIYLASNGWRNKQSYGDWIIIHPSMDLPAFHNTSISDFKSLNISPDLVIVLNKMSVKQPTLIQEIGVPKLLSGNNALIAAETGSGKTLAYLLPIIQNICSLKSESVISLEDLPLAVILVPSHELVEQVSHVAKNLCEGVGLTVFPLCSGKMNSCEKADIIVSTPGILKRVCDKRIYKLNKVHHLVLDEGDTLMDDSFNQVVLSLLRSIDIQVDQQQSGAQVVIVAATMPTDLRNILGELIDMNAITMITTPTLHHVLPNIKQRFERVKPSEKSDIMVKAIQSSLEKSRPSLVFCNTSSAANHLGWRLEELNINHCLLTGKLPPVMRRGRFDAFQSGVSDVLIATDIASRGLDTTRVKDVYNYDFPDFVSDYIHRIGRIGRVRSSANCLATSYISQKWEVERLWTIEKSVRQMTELHDVNANIKRKIADRHQDGEDSSILA